MNILNLPHLIDLNLDHLVNLPALRDHIERVGVVVYDKNSEPRL